MIVLTLNCGSSSVKYALLDMPARQKLCNGIVDRVGLAGALIKHSVAGGEPLTTPRDCSDHTTAVGLIVKSLTIRDTGVISDLSRITAVGHRVVHGGETLTKSTIINKRVVREIEELSVLAPLHNPPNLAGIRAAMALMPNIPHVAVLDTAFFTTIAPHVYIYPLPYQWYEKYRIRKYGFHGTSHQYVSSKAAALLGKAPADINLITLHIGNGVSVTAVKGGAAYDHSMGFTPLEGAVMGTRCGDIDPAIPLYVMKKEKLAPDAMEDMLNRKSGLLGITGKYSDRRELLRAMDAGDERAKLAFEIECYRLRKYIGAYAAGMGGVDAIAFTAGVGENSPRHRERICEGLEFLGLKIDRQKNERAVGGTQEMEISSADSKVKVFVIPTDEESIIAEEVYGLLNRS